MRFYCDVVKTPDNPTKGKVGQEGEFMAIIYFDDGPGSITNWREYVSSC